MVNKAKKRKTTPMEIAILENADLDRVEYPRMNQWFGDFQKDHGDSEDEWWDPAFDEEEADKDVADYAEEDTQGDVRQHGGCIDG